MRSLFVLLFAIVLCLGEAKITSLSVDHDNRRVFHIESFGFEIGGTFHMEMKDLLLWYDSSQKPPAADYAYKLAFVLQRSANDEGVRVEQTASNEETCFHESGDDIDRTVFPVDFINMQDGHTWDLKITAPGYYHLYFSNCEKYTLVGFQIDITQYNVEKDGSKNYLPAGESSLPMWFFLISAAFGVLFVVWVQHLIRYKAEIKNIHYLMTLVLVLKLLTVFFESFEYHYIKTTGSSHGWNIVYYIFSFLKGMMMFMVIVLIGTGWSYLKPFLTERDKQIMLAVIVVQAMVNISAVILDEMSPGSRDFLTWRDVLHLLDMICCCFILLPIVWSIRHLKEAATVDGKAARVMVRLQRFRKFYVLVVSYIYFTRIIVFLLGATLPFELVWLAVVFRESAAIIFYGVTGFLFRPLPHNPYLEVSVEDEDEDKDNAEKAARNSRALELGPL